MLLCYNHSHTLVWAALTLLNYHSMDVLHHLHDAVHPKGLATPRLATPFLHTFLPACLGVADPLLQHRSGRCPHFTAVKCARSPTHTTPSSYPLYATPSSPHHTLYATPSSPHHPLYATPSYTLYVVHPYRQIFISPFSVSFRLLSHLSHSLGPGGEKHTHYHQNRAVFSNNAALFVKHQWK